MLKCMTLKYYMYLFWTSFVLIVLIGFMSMDISLTNQRNLNERIKEQLKTEKTKNRYRVDQFGKVVEGIANEYPAVGQAMNEVIHDLREGNLYKIDQKISDLPKEMKEFIFDQKIELYGLNHYKIFNENYVFPVEIDHAYIPEKYGEFGWRPRVFNENYEYVYKESLKNNDWVLTGANDIVNPYHPGIFASNYGYVLDVGVDKMGGRYIILEHRIKGEPLRKTKYFHLAETQVKKGEYVYKGQQIALMGKTGMVTAQHLDWTVQEWDGKRWVYINGVIGTTHNREWMRGYYYYKYNDKWYAKTI